MPAKMQYPELCKKFNIPNDEIRHWRKKWADQRNYGKGSLDRLGNPIQFKLTFEEWFSLWHESGFLYLRGNAPGTFCMARIDDIGHYEIGNVQIVPNVVNSRESSSRPRGKYPEERVANSKAAKAAKALAKGH